MEKNAKYYRVYYKLQELLAGEFLANYEDGEQYGVRATSSLPPELNREADKIAQYIINVHPEPPKPNKHDDVLDASAGTLFFTDEWLKAYQKTLDKQHIDAYKAMMPQEQIEIEAKEGSFVAMTDKDSFHYYLDGLNDDLRPMVDAVVVADNYYVVVDNISGDVIGGFGTNSNGYMTGLFSCIKNRGGEIFEHRLYQAKEDLREPFNSLKLNCIGNFLARFFIAKGFEITKVYSWDERLAPANWNSAKYGTPYVYDMEMVL